MSSRRSRDGLGGWMTSRVGCAHGACSALHNRQREPRLEPKWHTGRTRACRMPDAGHRVPGAGYRVPGTGMPGCRDVGIARVAPASSPRGPRADAPDFGEDASALALTSMPRSALDESLGDERPWHVPRHLPFATPSDAGAVVDAARALRRVRRHSAAAATAPRAVAAARRLRAERPCRRRLNRPRAQPGDAVTLRIEVGPRGSGCVRDIGLEAYVRDVVVGELSVGAARRRTGASRLRGPGHRRAHLRAGGTAPACRRRLRPVLDDALPGVRARPVAAQSVGGGRGCRGRADARAVPGKRPAAPIEAVFHAHCGGHTSAAADVWRSAGATYLRASTIRTASVSRQRPGRARWTSRPCAWR